MECAFDGCKKEGMLRTLPKRYSLALHLNNASGKTVTFYACEEHHEEIKRMLARRLQEIDRAYI